MALSVGDLNYHIVGKSIIAALFSGFSFVVILIGWGVIMNEVFVLITITQLLSSCNVLACKYMYLP